MINAERNIVVGCPDAPRKRLRARSRLLRLAFVTALVLSSLGIFTPSNGQAATYVGISYHGRPYYGYPYVYRGRYYYNGRYWHNRYYRSHRWHYY